MFVNQSASKLIIPALVLKQYAINLHLIASLVAVVTISRTNFGVKKSIEITRSERSNKFASLQS